MATGIPIAVGELIDTPTINTWARGYLRKNTAKTVNGTSGASDLLNGEFTIPANAMGTDKILRLTAWGDWKQNSGGSTDFTRFRLIFGSTTLLATNTKGVSNILANSSGRNGWKMICEIQNLGAADSQWATMDGTTAAAVDTANQVFFDTGNGTTVLTSGGLLAMIGSAAAAVDTKASCDLKLNVLNASSSANFETKLAGALVEII